MKHLTIVVPDGYPNLVSIVGAYMILTRAESYWQSMGNKSIFNIELAGISQKVGVYEGLFSIYPKRNISQIEKTDLIVIPALLPQNGFSPEIKKNKTLVSWINKQYKNGAEIASICTGIFILASTGLVNGKSCSTHWAVVNDFKEIFPKVNLVPDKIITYQDGIYTSGGAFSFLNFLLYLIEKYYDRCTAIYCAKVFEIDMSRESQSQFSVFRGQKNHPDEEIKKAQIYIEKNFQEKISIEKLADKYAIGRRNFDRRFKKATGNTPIEYLQRVKIEAAKKDFETTRKSITEVMYEVGYSDFKAFRTTFKKITGLSPIEYRNKFNKDKIVEMI